MGRYEPPTAVYLSPDVVDTLRANETKQSAIERERQERQRLRAQARLDRMRAGPCLEPNCIGGQWVYIPSDWHDEEARAFWVSVGCRFLRHEKAWVRPVDLPYQSKRYTPQQWLRSLRRKFFEFYDDELAEREEQRQQ